MIATIRKLDLCGTEIWRLTTSHGVDLRMDLATQAEAEAVAIGSCRRVGAWPLCVDTYLTPDSKPESRILDAYPVLQPA